MQELYPSKLMIFGEYAVLAGGEGLAIPWDDFVLVWIEDAETPSAFYPHLVRFAQWLGEQGFDTIIDVAAFQSALQNGLDVASTIPIGYGVGSSGAVVAAVYDRFARTKIPVTEIELLKQTLASMENFFHSTSSGLDPLVCYQQKPVHITPNGIHILDEVDLDILHMQLLDCGVERSTQTLVDAFRARMQTAEMQEALQHYIQLSNACIHALLQKDAQALVTPLRQLSQWQWQYFDFAIPPHLRNEWAEANTHQTAIYKLCGAGGGGFMLVFSKLK